MKLKTLILLLVVPFLLALSGCASENPEGKVTPNKPAGEPTVSTDAKSGNSAATFDAAGRD